jgi:hypothetical protein
MSLVIAFEAVGALLNVHSRCVSPDTSVAVQYCCTARVNLLSPSCAEKRTLVPI